MEVSEQSANPTDFSCRNPAGFHTHLGCGQSERKTHVFRQSLSAVHGGFLRAKSDPFAICPLMLQKSAFR